jgi:DNA-binding transcriptional regulator YdaS (Cro superfamily)
LQSNHKSGILAPMKCVAEIVEKVGGQSALAKMCGVRQSHVWNWLNRRGSKGIPPQHVITVERATGIPRHEIRPDIFPDEGGI